MNTITRYSLAVLFALGLSLGVSQTSFGSEMETAEAQYPQTCQAVTRCWNGAIIACRTFGWGCNWWVIPGQSVQCTGYNGWGQYVNFYYRCF